MVYGPDPTGLHHLEEKRPVNSYWHPHYELRYEAILRLAVCNEVETSFRQKNRTDFLALFCRFAMRAAGGEDHSSGGTQRAGSWEGA